MANFPKVQNKIDKSVDELGVVSETPTAYNNIDTVSIMSLMDARVEITGTVTGNSYIFPRAGTVQDVDVRDKDEILNKKRGRACCGNSGGYLFQLA